MRLREVTWKILQGDCRTMLATLPDASVQTCVTSPPYWGLRDYGVDGQLGLEDSPVEYVDNLVGVFREVRRVLRDDGTLWLNLGDSYAGARGGAQGASGQMADRSVAAARCRVRNRTRTAEGLKSKDLVGIPWRVAFALQADGWYLRSDIIWSKPNPMPESVTDRPTRAHEYLFLFSKSPKYHYDADAIREACLGIERPRFDGTRGKLPKSAVPGQPPQRDRAGNHPLGRNKRTVWTVTPRPFKGAHFAVMPPELVEPCVLAGSPVGGIVLDPFNGAGTTGMVATRLQRDYIGIEINPAYAEMARRPIEREAPLFNAASAT